MAEELLSEQERRIALEEIGQVALAIGRDLYGETVGSLPTATGERPGALSGLERLAFLDAHVSAIEQAAARVAKAPRTELRPEVREVPVEQARYPLPQALAQAWRYRRPSENGDSEVLPGSPGSWLAARLGGKLPRTLAESVALSTTDTPENRYVGAILTGWRRDLRAIMAEAAWVGEAAPQARARTLEARFRRLGEMPFLQNITFNAPTLPTDALLRSPHYRVFYDLDRRYRRLLKYAWDAPALWMPAKEAWLLYEMWCFFRVAAVLRYVGMRAVGGDAMRLIRGRLTVAPARGQASRLLFGGPGASVSLFYNRTFPSATVGARGPASRTHVLIPDICLERAGRFLILDAKYRAYDELDSTPEASGKREPFLHTNSSLLEDIDKIQVTDNRAIHSNPALLNDVDKMHTYRDAIVKDGEQVVESAWCLYPGRTAGGPDIIAYPPSTPDQPFGTAGIGAIRLRPGTDEGLLARLVMEWVAA